MMHDAVVSCVVMKQGNPQRRAGGHPLNGPIVKVRKLVHKKLSFQSTGNTSMAKYEGGPCNDGSHGHGGAQFYHNLIETPQVSKRSL